MTLESTPAKNLDKYQYSDISENEHFIVFIKLLRCSKFSDNTISVLYMYSGVSDLVAVHTQFCGQCLFMQVDQRLCDIIEKDLTFCHVFI